MHALMLTLFKVYLIAHTPEFAHSSNLNGTGRQTQGKKVMLTKYCEDEQ